MARICILFFHLVFAVNIWSQKLLIVKGEIMTVPIYCGGAELSDEDKGRFKPYPLANKTMFIRKGDTNNIKAAIVKEFKTDKNGAFSISLPTGTYIIIDSLKKDSTYIKSVIEKYSDKSKNFQSVDKACLGRWLKKPDMAFKVTSSGCPKVNIFYYQRCAWDIECILYPGPPPPSTEIQMSPQEREDMESNKLESR